MGLRSVIAARSVAVQILLLQLVVVLLVVAVGVSLALVDARRDQREAAAETTLLVAHTLAASPTVREAVTASDPTAVLQPYALAVQQQTGTDFVVIMSTAGIRWTHPDPTQIGGHFRGSITQAAAGQDHVETYTGTLGPSVRAVVPVRADAGSGGEVVALVSVGVTTERLSRSFWPGLIPVGLAALGVLLVGSTGAALVSRRLRRQTAGLDEQQLTSMLDYYDAVLHSIGEGIVLVGLDHRIRLVNDEARRLLGVDPPVGAPVTAAGLPEALARTLDAPREVHDEWHLVGDRILVLNRRTARWRGRALGTVTTLRDHTELRAVTTELDSTRSLADALHAQSHEAANRMHTVVSLIELGRAEEAVAFATGEIDRGTRLGGDLESTVADPVVAALLLGKIDQAGERGVPLRIDADVAAHGFDDHDLLTLLGNLIDNAIDAAAGTSEPAVAATVMITGDRLSITVDDSGPGIDPAQAEVITRRGWSTKSTDAPGGRGLGLALVLQTVRRLGGQLIIDRADLGGARFVVAVG